MRVLFTTQPGHGHLQPMAPYAQALAAAGDEVRVATAQSFCPAIESLGLEPVPAGVDFTWERPTDRFPQLVGATRDGTMGEAVREIVWDHWVPSMIDDLSRVFRSWMPDLIVREAAEQAAMFASQVSETPCAVAAWGAVLTDPIWELAVIPASVVREEYARRAGDLGISPDVDAYWADELTLSSLPPSWIPAELERRPPTHHFRMPPLDGADDGDGWEPRGPDARPLIYATLGTVFGWDRELRSILLDAFDGIDADVVMTVGRRADPSRITAPPNVRIEQYVPQSLLLPTAALVVSHAGLGTMIGAIAAGVPMVLLDLGADHPLNGGRAETLGIAETFRRDGLEASELRVAIERSLTDPARRARAAALAEEYARLPPPEDAVEVLHRHAERAA